MTDGDLIRRILAGEECLFARVVERYMGRIWALCRGYVHAESDCEDVVQEVFVKCYRDLGSLRNPDAFGGWLYRLAKRRCLLWRRARASRDAAMSRYAEAAKTDSREQAEVRNEADTLCFSAKKLIDEAGDKIDKEKKKTIEKQVEKLRAEIAKDDFDSSIVKDMTEQLSKDVQEIGAKLYEQASKEVEKEEKEETAEKGKKGEEKGDKKKDEKKDDDDVKEGEVV